MPESRPEVTRRSLLGLAGLGAVAGAGWWVGPARIDAAVDSAADTFRAAVEEARSGGLRPGPGQRERPQAVAAADLTGHRELAGAPLVYEVTGAPGTFPMEAAFAARLDASLRSHWEATGWGVPAQLRTYGTWRQTSDGEDASSWHHAGRGFDLAAVRGGDGGELVSCRYDLWGGGPDQDRQAREYWRMAATLHRDFAFVLTYLYDGAHHNHIHVDNGLSGDGPGVFRPGSRLQVHAVQAMCTHVWGLDVPVTGRWDTPTWDATTRVLDRIGAGGRLTSGQSRWQSFLSATAVHQGQG